MSSVQTYWQTWLVVERPTLDLLGHIHKYYFCNILKDKNSLFYSADAELVQIKLMVSLVKGADMRFCGSSQDSRVVCCLPGARCQWLLDILKEESEQPVVVVHVVQMTWVGKGMRYCNMSMESWVKELKANLQGNVFWIAYNATC